MPSKPFVNRDYSLTGPESQRAQERGLAGAEWYTSPIPRKRMKDLMKRKNGPAIRDTIIWLVLLIGFGFLAYRSWDTWWAVPTFIAYGILYATPGDSRWHECGHGTAFKTPWMNEVVYQIASFLILRPPTPWRWSHARHHTDTFIVGRDPEIAAPRPPVWHRILMEIVHLYGGTRDLKRMVLHCFGRFDDQEKEYIPIMQRRIACWESRVWVIIFVAVVVWAIQIRSMLPVMLIGLPSFYGSFVVLLFGITQHLGLKEDVLDHRLNTRTIYMNPVFRFLYWNMNYHIEHHMFPMVPYHALPALHEEMKSDSPPACPSLWAALKEVISTLIKERRDPEFAIVRPLPSTARPYQFGPQPVETTGSNDGSGGTWYGRSSMD